MQDGSLLERHVLESRHIRRACWQDIRILCRRRMRGVVMPGLLEARRLAKRTGRPGWRRYVRTLRSELGARFSILQAQRARERDLERRLARAHRPIAAE